MEKNFSVGDLVWAKVRGHPYWPAEISNPATSKSMFSVVFFGTQEIAVLHSKHLKKFTATSDFPPKKRLSYKRALEEIERRNQEKNQTAQMNDSMASLRIDEHKDGVVGGDEFGGPRSWDGDGDADRDPSPSGDEGKGDKDQDQEEGGDGDEGKGHEDQAEGGDGDEGKGDEDQDQAEGGDGDEEKGDEDQEEGGDGDEGQEEGGDVDEDEHFFLQLFKNALGRDQVRAEHQGGCGKFKSKKPQELSWRGIIHLWYKEKGTMVCKCDEKKPKGTDWAMIKHIERTHTDWAYRENTTGTGTPFVFVKR